MEFLAPSNDEEEVVLSDQVAQLALDPMMVVFEKPADNERQHLKSLFVKGRVDGQPGLYLRYLSTEELRLILCPM
jgi:hypothetical protein